MSITSLLGYFNSLLTHLPILHGAHLSTLSLHKNHLPHYFQGELSKMQVTIISKDSPALTGCISNSLIWYARHFFSGFCLLVQPHLPPHLLLSIKHYSYLTHILPHCLGHFLQCLCFVYIVIISRLNSRVSSSMKPFYDSSQNSHVVISRISLTLYLRGTVHIANHVHDPSRGAR